MDFFGSLHLRSPLQSLNKVKRNNEKLIDLFNEGLFLASPEYWRRLQKVNISNAKEKEKIETTFSKYWLRSCSRCTPYGTFAGSALATIDDQKTSLVLGDINNYSRAVRLDMNYLYTIIRSLERTPSIEKQIQLFKNNSIYETPLTYRYAEYSISNNQRRYRLASVEKTAYIIKVLDTSNSGATIGQLSQILTDFTSSTYEEAYEFIKQMWDSQLLVSELEPSVTGEDPFKALLTKLNDLKDIPIDLRQLSLVSDMMNNVSDIQSYLKIEERLEQIFSLPLPKNTIQVDLFLSLEDNKIQKSIIDSVFAQLKELMVFTRPAKSTTLDSFKSRFLEKFEGREIPLNMALDAELGIGYTGLSSDSVAGSEWIDDIAYRSPNITASFEFDKIQEYSLKKYHEYINSKQDIIQIEQHELTNFGHNLYSQYPNSMCLMGSFLKKNGQFDDKNYMFDFHSIGGPSGGNMLGRFAFGDKNLERLTKLIAKEEENQNPDVIYAEIAHLPEERIGNILLRPLLRDYEIPYLGRSGATKDNQILIEDLLVRVTNDEIVLRSRRLNKRVIPRLTTAHNFSGFNSLPIYKFLCEIQFQGMAFPIIWDWGILQRQKHLPRVVYKNIIIKKARWMIDINDIKETGSSEYFTADKLSNILKNRGLPQDFVIKQSDNKLLIQLSNEQSINILIDYIKKYKQIEIEEFVFNEDNCILHDNKGNPFTHEVIIPFKNYSSTLKSQEYKDPLVNIKIRKFTPGSEWLFFKIYCGAKIAEGLLTGPIYSFIEQALAKKDFEQFFFIRYKDSSPHIRIRFYSSDQKKIQELQKKFIRVLQPFVDHEIIHSVVLDTYDRELERYGMELIEDAEALFFHDSLAVVKILKLLEGVENENYRILLALRGIDHLLDDFNFNLSEKLELLKGISRGMLHRFGGQSNLQTRINEKYKRFQKTIFQHMDKGKDVINQIDDAIAIFDFRSEMNSKTVRSLSNKIPTEDLHERTKNLLVSLIHMFVNRLFIAQQLKYELLVYVFLERYYSSIHAIKNKGLKTSDYKT